MFRERRIDLRVTNKEYDILKQKADLSDMTISEYLRSSGLNKKVKGFKLSNVNTDEQIPGQMSFAE